jgi:hypothetical protein
VDISNLVRTGEDAWRLRGDGTHRDAILHGSKGLIEGMDERVREQIQNVTAIPATPSFHRCIAQ